MKYAADIASRRHVDPEAKRGLLARWKHEVGLAIMRRRAAMARAVLPKPTSKERWMLVGGVNTEVEQGGKMASIQEG